MNEQTPDKLGTLLDRLPVGDAPIDHLLRSGHAAKRRRRVLASSSVATVALILGGALLGTNAIANRFPSGGDAPAASAQTEKSERAIPVDLPTSDWKPGDFAFQARISGTLALDENGCVFLEHPGYKERIYAIWPSGYTAETDPDGRLTLRAPDGTEVAHGGDEVSMGGSYGPAPDDPHPCLPRNVGEVARVQSEVAATTSSPRATQDASLGS